MVQRAINHYGQMSRAMVADTTRFLDWALHNVARFPRIPRVRVDSGVRFSERIKVAFWSSALLRMSDLKEPPAK